MLELYRNIKELRKQNKWTQEDLAKRMGYNDRSSIAKIEAGKVDLSQRKIVEFARVFGVDPGALMGWDPGEDMVVHVEYNDNLPIDDAIKLYELYSKASPDVQSAIELLLRSAQPGPGPLDES